METVDEIENAVRQLSNEELAIFRDWFAKYDTELWDRQFEEDFAGERFNTLAQKALCDMQDE